MSARKEPPLEATVLPDLPKPRRAAGGAAASWLLASGAFLGFMAIFALLLFGLGRFLESGRDMTPGRPGSLLQKWETPAERLSACRQALEIAALEAPQKSPHEASAARPTAVELRELDRFFLRVAESRFWSNSTRLEALFDLDALADRIVRHPALANSQRTSRQRLRRLLEHEDQYWPEWSEIQVVTIRRGVRDELLVYTFAARDDADPEPVRWWLRRRGRSWRVADWERVTTGCSEAGRRAFEEALAASDDTPTFRRTLETIRGALASRDANNLPFAAQQLLKVGVSQHPALVADVIQIELAFAWQACGRPDQVLAACDRLQNPTDYPAVHYLRALVHAERDQFAETIQSAAAYREQVGIHPHLLALQAEALEALGQERDAAACWKDRLAMLPGDQQALAERTRLAGSAAAQVCAEALSQSRDAEGLALQAGLNAIAGHDETMYGAVAAFLQARPESAAALARLSGERDWRRGHPQAAADHLRRAWQASAGQAGEQAALERFLDTMAASGRAAAGYAEAPDPAQAFAYLTEGLSDGEAVIELDDLPPLLAAHRQKQPADALSHYLQGLSDLRAGRYAAAEQSFAAGELVVEDDDLREQLRSGKLEALYLQRRLADAYQAYGADQEPIFQQLARLCHQSQDWPGLDELIALHRHRHADDPWIDYFLARRYEVEGDDAQALAAARKAEASGDEALNPQLTWLINNLSLRVEGISQAYLNSGDQREAFRRLVSHLARAEDWDGILELTDLYSAGGRQRSSSIYWSAKAQWNGGEYEKIAANLFPWPYDRLTRLEGEQIAELYDIAVRSLLRAGRIDDAAETARHARDEYGLELPQIAVALAQQDQQEIHALLEQRRIARALFHRPLYRDRDLAALLTNPEVASFRRRHALAWPEEYGQRNVSLVLLYPRAPAAAAVEAEEQAVAILGAARVSKAADGTRSWLWQVGADTLVLTPGSGPYASCDGLPAWLPASDPERTIFEQHDGWIAIDLLLADQAIRDSLVRPAAAQLAAALAELGAEACFVSGPRGPAGRLLSLDENVLEQIQSGKIFKAAIGDSGDDRWYCPTPPVIERPKVSQAELLGELTRTAHRSRATQPAGQAQIRVRLTRGHASEDLWLTVIRSRRVANRAAASGETFIAELTESSALWPHLARGERLLVPYHVPLEVMPLTAEPALGSASGIAGESASDRAASAR